MTCRDCFAARETSGLWRYFDPLCLWCGARLIQRLGNLRVMPSEIAQRRRAVLVDWVAQGHPEQELRLLAKGPIAYAPVKKEGKAKC